MLIINARILKDPLGALTDCVFPFNHILHMLHDQELALGTTVRYNECIFTVVWYAPRRGKEVGLALRHGNEIIWGRPNSHNSSGIQLVRPQVRS